MRSLLGLLLLQVNHKHMMINGVGEKRSRNYPARIKSPWDTGKFLYIALF
uniref:Uncharacterized protein n=1 Tax=Anguilla anguilla TaxID=7936 RepID=A0A0E9TCS6_ANGAN